MENDARRAQLITLALGVFSVNAYDEVSMDNVARAAGISKGLVYHYFPTKRHFYVAALREAARQLLEQTTPQDELAPADRLREGLEAYLSFVEKHARAYTTLLRGGIGVDKEVNVIVEAQRVRRPVLLRVEGDGRRSRRDPDTPARGAWLDRVRRGHRPRLARTQARALARRPRRHVDHDPRDDHSISAVTLPWRRRMMALPLR
jgi:AcrR family transcriptional regulator